MPTHDQPQEEALRSGRPASEFPDSRFPTAYADGVMSLTPGPGLVKFFLYRVDPNAFGRGGNVNNPFLQIAMHNYGFAQMTLFFQRQLKRLVDQKQIQPELIELIEQQLNALEAAQSSAQSSAGTP
jgi:hypothetical protein